MIIEAMPPDLQGIIEHPFIHPADLSVSPEMGTVLSALSPLAAHQLRRFADDLQHNTEAFELGIAEHRRAGIKIILVPNNSHPVYVASSDFGKEMAIITRFCAAVTLSARWKPTALSYVHLGCGEWTRLDTVFAACAALGQLEWFCSGLSAMKLGHVRESLLRDVKAVSDELREHGAGLRYCGEPRLRDEVAVRSGLYGFTLSKVELIF